MTHLQTNRNACKVHDFDKFGLQKYLFIAILNTKILQSHLEELGKENESKY